MTKPKKVNSRLKQLAESRARHAATTERINNRIFTLQLQIEEAKATQLRLEELQFELRTRLVNHHNDIRATDKIIRAEFPNVDPDKILPTFGFRAEYGKRGALLDTIRTVLGESGDHGLTLKEVGLRVTERLKLVHHTPEEFNLWMKNSLESAMKKLCYKKCEIQRVKVPGKHPRWCLLKKSSSWADLVELEHEVEH